MLVPPAPRRVGAHSYSESWIRPCRGHLPQFYINFTFGHYTSVLFVGPLILLFWNSSEFCSGFQSLGRFLTCILCRLHAMDS